MSQSKLSFVIGGTQKGGTSTLDAIFRRHPQIQMASIKETHFFDDESLDWKVVDYSKLHACFDPTDQGLRGEATPITLYWRPAIRRLHDYNPDIKIILLLRDPVERAFSHWCHEYRLGRDVMLFRDAIREGRRRLQSEAETEGLHRCFSYVERGFYGEQLAYLLNYFPRRQIHCEVSEEFFRDRKAALQRLSSFLAIDPFPDALPHVHENAGGKFAYPSTLTPEDAGYLATLFSDDIAVLEALLGRSIPVWGSPIQKRP